ncbi:PREDICTED: uncharacterized protein LOC104698930 [Camelina sativa]|uniref:Uncharacterized protein LOC104698930 n=1 Tax=Camelina sativa TaxID=90675 RepID=A0ABM0SKS6_CAMSA|nr:PREDICTED: uncharacterized protein LOC104698930 [Camelina sativa]
MTSDRERRKVPFKFYNLFTAHSDYPTLLQNAWNVHEHVGSPMSRLCQKLKAVKLGCKELNRIYFSNIQARTAEAQEALTRLQSQILTNPSPLLFHEEKQKLLGTKNSDVQPMSIEDIQNLTHYRCSSELATTLQSIPIPEEVTSAMFSLPKNKAPGPDGFTADFFTHDWGTMGPIVVEAVTVFFTTGKLIKQACFLLQHHLQGDISDSGKEIKVVYGFGGSEKSGIIHKRRLLCENVMLAAELVADFHKPGPITRGCLQIDISKVFDNVDWVFLTNILTSIELPSTFVNWLVTCFTTPLALNGELIGYFPGNKGLRQGDSISAPLFALVMDILSKQLDRAVTQERIKPRSLCIQPLITHLNFADNLLVLFDGSESSLVGILETLDMFKLASGLGINLTKSCLFLDGDNRNGIRSMSSRLNLTHGSLPIRYLGFPLITQKLSASDYQPLIDKVKSRISGWTHRHLLFAGRLQLLQSVINNTINFWASIFMLPSKCLKELERICSAFLWKGVADSARGAKVSWDVVCTAKSAGGLGLKRLADWNRIFGLETNSGSYKWLILLYTNVEAFTSCWSSSSLAFSGMVQGTNSKNGFLDLVNNFESTQNKGHNEKLEYSSS